MLSRLLLLAGIFGACLTQQPWNRQPQQNQPFNQQRQQPFNQQNQNQNQFRNPNQGQSQFVLGQHPQQQPQQQFNQPNQYGYNQYNQYGQQQQTSVSNQKGILNNPVRPKKTFIGQPGAIVQFGINGYNNQGMRLADGNTCLCPNPNGCTFLQNVPNPCLISFTVIFTTADQNVQYISSDFVSYNGTGSTPSLGNWNQNNTLSVATKPQSIDVFVHNLGVNIAPNGNLVYFNHLTLVDAFVIDLTTYSPTTNGNVNTTNGQYQGQNVSSTLFFSYSVQCQQGYMGQLCDMQCSQSQSDNTHIVCTSTVTGQQNICNYTDSTKTQIQSCQPCLNGVVNMTCSEWANILSLESDKVSKAFKVWTIVLGVLLGLAIIFIILLLILFIISRRQSERQNSYQRQPNYNAGYSGRAPQSVTNPLLAPSKDEWSRSHPPAALGRGAHQDADLTQSTVSEQPRNGHMHYSPRREAEV